MLFFFNLVVCKLLEMRRYVILELAVPGGNAGFNRLLKSFHITIYMCRYCQKTSLNELVKSRLIVSTALNEDL